MEVSIDREVCVGSGSCVYMDPDVFDQDDDDARAVLLIARPDDSHRDSIAEAVVRCPVSAIQIVED